MRVGDVTSSTVADDSDSEGMPLSSDRVLRLPRVETFDGFYAREYPSLVAFAHVLTGSRSHAEDVAQEAMLAVYRRWDEVARLDSPAGWARRVCANLSTSFVRRRLVEARAALRLRGRATEVGVFDDDDGLFWAEVRRLPRRQAQCVALRYIYGCSVTEVAQVLECAEGTVRSHLARGKTALARRLGENLDEGAES